MAEPPEALDRALRHIRQVQQEASAAASVFCEIQGYQDLADAASRLEIEAGMLSLRIRAALEVVATVAGRNEKYRAN